MIVNLPVGHELKPAFRIFLEDIGGHGAPPVAQGRACLCLGQRGDDGVWIPLDPFLEQRRRQFRSRKSRSVFLCREQRVEEMTRVEINPARRHQSQGRSIRTREAGQARHVVGGRILDCFQPVEPARDPG